jgi:diketogulonate reductase-like aldo/keto reductase
MEEIKLNSGHTIPNLGFGVWKAPRGECQRAVLTALQVGYRHIDTASIYGNEEDVGKAIRESGVPRDEIFVTTKLWNSSHARAEIAFEESLKKLGLDYVDLYLIHFPVTKTRVAAYHELEKIQLSGRAKSIGVSNYMPAHLDELLTNCSVKPAVNQIELHPWLSQIELKEYCESRGIHIEAYSPLAHGEKVADVALLPIAKKYNKSIAQVLLRWSIQRGNIVLVKSVSENRIRENFNIFDFVLDDADMKFLNGLNEDLRTCWDPSKTP